MYIALLVCFLMMSLDSCITKLLKDAPLPHGVSIIVISLRYWWWWEWQLQQKPLIHFLVLFTIPCVSGNMDVPILHTVEYWRPSRLAVIRRDNWDVRRARGTTRHGTWPPNLSPCWGRGVKQLGWEPAGTKPLSLLMSRLCQRRLSVRARCSLAPRPLVSLQH